MQYRPFVFSAEPPAELCRNVMKIFHFLADRLGVLPVRAPAEERKRPFLQPFTGILLEVR
jgi:hypothetical protein